MSATATEDNQPVVGEVDAKEDAKSKAAAEPEAKPPGTKKIIRRSYFYKRKQNMKGVKIN